MKKIEVSFGRSSNGNIYAEMEEKDYDKLSPFSKLYKKQFKKENAGITLSKTLTCDQFEVSDFMELIRERFALVGKEPIFVNHI